MPHECRALIIFQQKMTKRPQLFRCNSFDNERLETYFETHWVRVRIDEQIISAAGIDIVLRALLEKMLLMMSLRA